MKLSKLLPVILMPLGLAFCDRGDSPPTTEQLAMQELVWRQACAAREVEAVAIDELATLESVLQSADPDDPLSQITSRATAAAAEFARAFERHAGLRTSAYAYLDSAVNVATTPADSARYIERAGAFSIQAPEAGSVEANVLSAYDARLTAMLQDEDHPCNWDTPFERR